MEATVHMLRIFLVFVVFVPIVISVQVKKYSLLMPNVHPNHDELYLCTPIKVVPKKSFYIVGFEPNATMETAHHMLLYGCTTPGSNQPYWNCGEMADSQLDNNIQRTSPCETGLHVLYAWARNAKKFELPEDVGFQIGEGTQIQYLVLQVHYAHTDKFKDGSTDDSGIFLMYTEKPRKKLAGVVLLGTGGAIPPNSVTHMESDCRINENKTIYPFAYRTHTHGLGKVVAGYKIREDENKQHHWTLLGKRDPLTAQMFYPVFNKDPIFPGDILAARCTMQSNRLSYTHVGATNLDEMCNFYLMYYVKSGTPLEMKYCFTQGPPYFYWDTENHLNNIPDKDASTL
ncbi:hypothetical protein FQR65_LT01616 [Abscondita terminalis]|nr:hypothetical protein FQR65_LT01616 [Abscondita terminalis]